MYNERAGERIRDIQHFVRSVSSPELFWIQDQTFPLPRKVEIKGGKGEEREGESTSNKLYFLIFPTMRARARARHDLFLKVLPVVLEMHLNFRLVVPRVKMHFLFASPARRAASERFFRATRSARVHEKPMQHICAVSRPRQRQTPRRKCPPLWNSGGSNRATPRRTRRTGGPAHRFRL